MVLRARHAAMVMRNDHGKAGGARNEGDPEGADLVRPTTSVRLTFWGWRFYPCIQFGVSLLRVRVLGKTGAQT